MLCFQLARVPFEIRDCFVFVLLSCQNGIRTGVGQLWVSLLKDSCFPSAPKSVPLKEPKESQ